MARRPKQLDPADGPIVEFAMALRRLRDRAGAAAPSVDAIAEGHHVSRSAIFKALNGEALPNQKTIVAVVDAWGGDVDEWVRMRNAYALAANVDAAKATPEIREIEENETPRPGSEPALIKEAAGDAWPMAWHKDAVAEGRFDDAVITNPFLAGAMTALGKAQPDLRRPEDRPGEKECVLRMKALLREARQHAGNPTMREISRRTGGRVTPSTVSNVLSLDHLATPKSQTVYEILMALGPAEGFLVEFYSAYWDLYVWARRRPPKHPAQMQPTDSDE